MEFYIFSKDVGKNITHYNSNFIMSRILQTDNVAKIGCMHLGKEGIIGYHEATVDQLFLVVAGEGYVRSGEEDPVFVQAGDAVFWKSGEWHETKTTNGLTAIVIESVELKPSLYMKRKIE